jgi:hypothetical protein
VQRKQSKRPPAISMNCRSLAKFRMSVADRGGREKMEPKVKLGVGG